jgi:hypothetical protein
VIETNTGNFDSSLAAMDKISGFHHGGDKVVADFIDVDGFGFAPASLITQVDVTVAAVFTTASTIGYFSDGNGVHSEMDKKAQTAQIYIDVNHDGNFDVATDMVIHLDGLKSNLVTADFQFH